MNEHIKDIEIALRDGLIDELSSTTETSINIIKRMSEVITHYQSMIEQWEDQNQQLLHALAEAIEQRDRARDTAVRLEQECHSCMDTVHHGNDEVYGTF